jgi:hypothetical protein
VPTLISTHYKGRDTALRLGSLQEVHQLVGDDRGHLAANLGNEHPRVIARVETLESRANIRDIVRVSQLGEQPGN